MAHVGRWSIGLMILRVAHVFKGGDMQYFECSISQVFPWVEKYCLKGKEISELR